MITWLWSIALKSMLSLKSSFAILDNKPLIRLLIKSVKPLIYRLRLCTIRALRKYESLLSS